MKLDKADVGQRIRQAREARDVNRNQLATGIGTSWDHVQRWEDGETMPGTEALMSIADFLDTTVDELLGREPQMGPSRGPNPYPAFHAFVRSKLGGSMTPEEQETLDEIRFRHGRPTEETYRGWLIWMRSSLEEEPGTDETEKFLESAKKKGGRVVKVPGKRKRKKGK